MLPWLWVQMRLCDVVHGIYGGKSPRAQTQGCYLHDTCVFIRTNTQEGRNEWGHRREKGVNPLWDTGERAATGLWVLALILLFVLFSWTRSQTKTRLRRGMFSPASVEKKCQAASGRGVKRVFSKNHFRVSMTSTDHCVQIKLRLMINLKSFSTSVWFPQTSRGYLLLQVLEESGWKMQMCHWLCTRVPVQEQLIVKDTLWSFLVNKHVVLSQLYVPLRPTCFSSSSVFSFSTFCWCFTVTNCQSVRYCGFKRSVEMRVVSPTSMFLDHETETKQELAQNDNVTMFNLLLFFFFFK